MMEVQKAIESLFRGGGKQGNTVTCLNCGVEVVVKNPEGQYTVRCPACGSNITMTRNYREFRGFVERRQTKIECPYCMDTGIVSINQQIDEGMYNFAYRCICPKGKERQETAIPFATGVDLAPLLKKFNKGGINVGRRQEIGEV